MSKERAAQLIDAGLWLKLSGDLDGAQKLFERALKLDPTNERARTLLDGRADVQPEVPGVVSSGSGISNPFSRNEAVTVPGVGAAESDWGTATGFQSPAPFVAPAIVSRSVAGLFDEPGVPAAPHGAPPIAPVAMTAPSIGVTVVIGGDELKPMPIEPMATPPQFEQTPRIVMIPGAPAPMASPPSSPLLSVGAPADTILISGEPFATSSPSSTPPLFMGLSPVPMISPPTPVGISMPLLVSEPTLAPAPLPHFSQATGWDASPGINLGHIEVSSESDAAADEVLPTISPSGANRQVEAEVRALLRGARDLLDLDDHSGAVELILKAQQLAPDDAEVQVLRERSERTLLAMFESKLGNMNAKPRVLLKDDEIIWLNLDHRAGFVLAQIDGSVSFDDIFAVSGMSRLDTARIIAQLIEEGVISRG